MKVETFLYSQNGKSYNVEVVYKRQRNIYYRLKEDGFHITAPSRVSKKQIIDGLNKFAEKLLRKYSQVTSNFSFEDDYIYLLGNRYTLSELAIVDEKQLNNYLKKLALETITKLVRKYEEIMGIKVPYKVGVRNTKTRYGSNSLRTHSLSFQISLVHYSEDIISSVVVHELSHEFHRNHQQGFYNCVYSYCPNYDELDKKLRKGIHL